MAKFFGPVGYALTSLTAPGVYSEITTEHNYYGDVTKNVRRSEGGESINDNLTVSNTISIVADPFAYENFYAMRYVKWMGSYWKINSVEVIRPRLILSIGGVYNGEKAATSAPIGGSVED